MHWSIKSKVISLSIGILLSFFTIDSLAQNSPQVQNQITVNYKDTIGNNYGTESNIVITPLIILGIDLWGEKQGQKDVIPGGIAAYTITYGNSGTQTAYGVNLCDQFPSQMESVVCQNSGYFLTIDPMTKHGTWNIDILPPGTYSFTMSIKIKQDTPGSSSIINTLNIVSSSLNEAYLPNNYAAATTYISSPTVDLWVNSHGQGSGIPGGEATYTVTCGNNGSETAASVVLVCQFSDQAASIIQKTSGFPFGWNAVTRCGTWNIGSLPPGTITFELSAKIRDNALGSTTIINAMRISCPWAETDYMNNQATVTTHITDADMEFFNMVLMRRLKDRRQRIG